jgi:hypothetical protein
MSGWGGGSKFANSRNGIPGGDPSLRLKNGCAQDDAIVEGVCDLYALALWAGSVAGSKLSAKASVTV